MKYFEGNGIRGIFNEKLTVELAYKVGVALSKVLENDTVVVGMDTRESSLVLAKALMSGFEKNIIFAGEVPTPVISHYAKENNIIGVMITASHNPYEYNGFRVFNKGFELTHEEKMMIESEIDKVTEIGEIEDFIEVNVDVLETYEKVYENIYKTNLIKFALDTANGAAFEVGPHTLINYGKEIYQMGHEPNGRNINYECGLTNLKYLQEFMDHHKLNLGFAFNGDADKVIVIEDGIVIDGDLIVYILANYLKKYDLLTNNTVVLTKASSPEVLDALTKRDIKYILIDDGKNIQEVIFEKDLSLGGEKTGYIILPDYMTTSDAILVSAILLNIIDEEKRALSDLIEDVKL